MNFLPVVLFLIHIDWLYYKMDKPVPVDAVLVFAGVLVLLGVYQTERNKPK